MRTFFVFIMLLWPCIATADDADSPHRHEPGAVQLCVALAHYKDIGEAAYKPGVDVYGNAVAGADLNDHSAMVPQTIEVPVTVDLAERLGHGLPEGAQLETRITTATIDRDGRVKIGGRDATEQVKTLCSAAAVVEPEHDDVPAPYFHQREPE